MYVHESKCEISLRHMYVYMTKGNFTFMYMYIHINISDSSQIFSSLDFSGSSGRLAWILNTYVCIYCH